MRAKKDAAKQIPLPKEQYKEYELFRHNLRLLRASKGLSAEALSKAVGLRKQYRCVDLETARGGPPKLEEVKQIAVYFKISIDQLLYMEAEISFKTVHQHR